MHIVRTCPDISLSRPFYELLEYKKLAENADPTPNILWTDGRMNLLLQEDTESYIGLKYYDEKLQEHLEELKKLNLDLIFEGKIFPNAPFQIVFTDPNGVKISIIEEKYDNLLAPTPRGDSTIPYGNFGEFALSTEDFYKTEAFWKSIGFEELMVSKEPYPWGIFTDGLLVLGLHQAADFDGIAMTYFKPEMEKAIKLLQEKGLVFRESEMSKIKDGNGITESPEGQLYFFFEGDIK